MKKLNRKSPSPPPPPPILLRRPAPAPYFHWMGVQTEFTERQGMPTKNNKNCAVAKVRKLEKLGIL